MLKPEMYLPYVTVVTATVAAAGTLFRLDAVQTPNKRLPLQGASVSPFTHQKWVTDTDTPNVIFCKESVKK